MAILTKGAAKTTTKPGQKTEPFREEIAKLAHELFLQRGGGDGQDLQDWLKAEKILKARLKQQ